MSNRALLFGGTDGHGIIMTALSERALEAEGFEVTTVCSYVRPSSENEGICADLGTGIPCLFWQYTFPYYMKSSFKDYALVVIVDIPFPEPDNRCPSLSVDQVVQQMKSALKIVPRIVLIDHHKNSFTNYGKCSQIGAEVIITSSAIFTHYGIPDEFTYKWGKYGAICDRDDAVLPVSEEDEIFAARIDSAKRDIAGSLNAIRHDNASFFNQFPPDTPHADTVLMYDSFVYVPRLAEGSGYKQLDQACKQYGKDYALGVGYQNPEKPVILLVTYWKSDNLPVALRLGMTRFRGHVHAPNLDYSPELIEKLILLFSSSHEKGDFHGTFTSGSDSFYSYVASFLRRVEIPYFLTLHKWGHVEHVIANGRTLGSLYGLSEQEQKILDWACLLHDIGYGIDRTVCPDFKDVHLLHHEFSEQMIRSWEKEGLFSGFLTHNEVDLIADMCLRHRKKMDLLGTDRDHLYILLRVADGMDNDYRRAQKNDKGVFYEELYKVLNDDSRREWDSHQAVLGLSLKIRDTTLTFQMIVRDREKAYVKIQDLELETEPLKRYFTVRIEIVDIADGWREMR
ncbi:HD domain-containing protein [Methanospirillum hungatei]|uniref:HD domain-containing protein n=1 Tax=Methanospirillum hungatei TaxID=2203 RepID=UPI0026EEBE79|nr:HD domain-containing protein [Methanospirillum hungatei]MCA1917055.1 HD domain-containing protein [Methanospirillum hungatei]